MVTIECESEVEFHSETMRDGVKTLLGQSIEDHKAKVVAEIRIGTQYDIELRLCANRPDEYGYRQTLAILHLSRLDLELAIQTLRTIEFEDDRMEVRDRKLR